MLMSVWHPNVCQCVCQMSIYLFCTRCCWVSCTWGVWLLPSLDIFLSSAISIYIVDVFLCSVFPIISQVTATTTTPPVTVVCYRPSTISINITMAPISLGLAALVTIIWASEGHSGGFCWLHHHATAAYFTTKSKTYLSWRVQPVLWAVVISLPP